MNSSGVSTSFQSQEQKFIVHSPAMSALQSASKVVARRDSTILLLGETGSGKEMLARAIHATSPRANKPFVTVDCSSLSETLFDSQLFGHVRGSFTSAVRDALGLVRSAHGGTLFLDEVGELTLPMQAKLLRVLQERTVTPIGSEQMIRVDFRCIAATHRDLERMVVEKSFRQDLFYRLYVVALIVPPLRLRREDIVPLARHFISSRTTTFDEPDRTLDHEAMELLKRYDWPGNVRELANAVEFALATGLNETITAADLPPRIRAARSTSENTDTESDLLLSKMEQRFILEALRRADQNKTAAARLLGIPVKRLRRKLKDILPFNAEF